MVNANLGHRAPERRSRNDKSQQTQQEKRFYDLCPRYEDHVRRVCARSVIVYRSDVAESLTLELSDLEQAYKAARTAAQEAQRSQADMEARFGAAITLVHLQVLAKVHELLELAESGAPVSDVNRLAQHLQPLTAMLSDIEARSSIAVTGDLNEEERNKIRHFAVARFVTIAQAMQLKRETLAAKRRFQDGKNEQDEALVARAIQRFAEIRADVNLLRSNGNADRDVVLDRSLKVVESLLDEAVPG